MKKIFYLVVFSMIYLPGCLKHPIHQGNVLNPDAVFRIGEGDTRFEVESLLGEPILKNTLHPNRVTYIEDFEDPETGKRQTRGLDIVYDDALRVVRIRRFGFDEKD